MRYFHWLASLAVSGVVLAVTPATQAQTRVFAVDQAGSFEYPAGWSPRHYANLHELWNATPERLGRASAAEQAAMARIETNAIACADHAEALRRLREIEAEWGGGSRFVTIGGWPALVRRQLIPKPTEGDDADADQERLWMVTTAVAAGSTVIRLDGFAPENTPQRVLDQMESIGRAVRTAAAGLAGQASKEVEELRRSPSLRRAPQPAPPAAGANEAAAPEPKEVATAMLTPGQAPDAGAVNTRIGSESEIAVSTNGTNIVVAQQCFHATSNNGGASFGAPAFYPGNCTGGDSSVAFGQSGNFYWATIGSNNATCSATAQNCNNIQEVARSTDNGVTFANSTTVIDCVVTSGCGFNNGSNNVPDQEHIAADRVNAGSSGDQVYLVFRKGFGYGISCSQDSGATWTAVAFHTGGSIDFPRITVSQNGTVFVVTNNGNNLTLDSYSSCKSGLTQNLNQVAIATGVNPVVCPVPGLDRCNNGNTLRSHTVAVDDTNANHLYAAYATNTIAPAPVPPGNAPTPLTTLGNENVLVQDSTDGGATWSAAVQVSATSNGRRYQPWVCATNGTAFVSWFDRRSATLTSNDLTDYFASSAVRNGGGLTAGTDFRVNGAADPECASGWGGQVRSPNDSESCSTQPQLAGQCRHSPNNNTDSKTPCDFAGTDATVCPTGETCQGGGGIPKYADYTGSACLSGRLYNAWPSGTNQPPGSATAIPISTFFFETVVGSTGTTLTYTGDTTGDYHDAANLTALLVLQGTTIPVAGQNVTFTLGAQTCGPVATNASGVAACVLTLNQTPNAGGGGPYTVVASFGGSGNLKGSSSTPVAFTITKEETTTTYTGPTLVANGVATTFSAVLKEDGTTPIAGRTLTITLGSGATAQSCTTGPTDATGTGSCTITPNQLTEAPIAANFAGDNFYLPSSASASAALNVTSQVTISVQPIQSLDRNSRDALWCTVISVNNPQTPPDRTTRATTIAGPLEVLITSLTPTVTLANPAGVFTGSPFTGSPFEILQPGALPPGGQVNAGLCFMNPNGVPITFVPVIVSGAI